MKKFLSIAFCVLFLLSISLPFAFTNFKPKQISEIDNTYLPEIDSTTIEKFVKSAEKYMNSRIGFRVEALNLYQAINDKCFSLMEHPSYMYGLNGHVFFKHDSYISDFQHLNLDEKWANTFSQKIKNFEDYCKNNGKNFLYMLIPDKKTVYSEYFPPSIKIINEVSRTEQVLSALDKLGVNYYWAKDTMLEGKKTMLVNNVKYDAGHWNENGAFIVFQEMYEILKKNHPQIESLSLDEFDVTEELMPSLMVSQFKIDEMVPLYTPKNSTAVDCSEEFKKSTIFPAGKDNYATRFVNKECADKPSILVIHDSYIKNNEKFFTEHFSESTFIHRYNIYNQECFEYYVDLLNPDIVIYENPERSWKIDLNKEYKIKK